MSRLTTKQYLAARTWLAELWFEDIGHWSQIDTADQRVLHDYFDPTITLSEEETLAHRRTVTAADPSLPQRAGRALHRFRRVMAGELALVPMVYVSPAHGRTKAHSISVRSVLRPTPDYERLARALLSLTPEEIKKLNEGETIRAD